jgi:pyruvate/2-oxoacid:ferredoxin oxidoreductase beta subunit
VACGIRSRRPDLHIFVVTGDGDCCAIGTAHWIHAIRYNMDMTVMLLDNNIYGLTKNQTSPTTPLGGNVAGGTQSAVGYPGHRKRFLRGSNSGLERGTSVRDD